MFIHRYDIKDTDYSKKFQIRNTISFEEYIHAYTKMLTAPNPPFPIAGALKFHLDHIKDISLLAQTKPWEYVRFWALFLFDSLESGNLNWEDLKLGCFIFRFFSLIMLLIKPSYLCGSNNTHKNFRRDPLMFDLPPSTMFVGYGPLAPST